MSEFPNKTSALFSFVTAIFGYFLRDFNMEALASSVTIPKFPEPYSSSLFKKPTQRTGFLRINDCTNFVGLRALSGEAEEAKPSANGFGFFSEEDATFEDASFIEVPSFYYSMDTLVLLCTLIYSCKRRPYKYAIRVYDVSVSNCVWKFNYDDKANSFQFLFY